MKTDSLPISSPSESYNHKQGNRTKRQKHFFTLLNKGEKKVRKIFTKKRLVYFALFNLAMKGNDGSGFVCRKHEMLSKYVHIQNIKQASYLSKLQ